MAAWKKGVTSCRLSAHQPASKYRVNAIVLQAAPVASLFPFLLQCKKRHKSRLASGFVAHSTIQAEIPEETPHMAIQQHLAELERRHQALEDELAEAMAHPSTDDLKIAELKRRKLQVKDELARLRQDASVH
jgi:hypothetical protein